MALKTRDFAVEQREFFKLFEQVAYRHKVVEEKPQPVKHPLKNESDQPRTNEIILK